MADKLNFTNFARTALSADITADAVQIEITDDTNFPDGLFTAVIWDASYASPLDDPDCEVVNLTRVSLNTMSAVRGQEGTAAKAWQSGAYVAGAVTAGVMNYLCETAVSAEAVTVADNTYEMGADEGCVFFTFDTGEAYKTVTLPPSSSAAGRTCRIYNRGGAVGQNIRLSPAAGDSFSNTTDAYITVTSGSSAELICTGGTWALTNYINAVIGGIKKVDSTYPEVSLADGTVFADASAGNIFIILSSEPAAAGLPLKIIRYDSTDNNAYIGGLTEAPYEQRLYAHMESVVVMGDPDGGIKLVRAHTPQAAWVKTATTHTTLRGCEKFITVEAGDSDVAVYLPDKTLKQGFFYTVKKTDAGAGHVVVIPQSGEKLDGGTQYTISAQYEYATFVSDGANWFRVG